MNNFKGRILIDNNYGSTFFNFITKFKLNNKLNSKINSVILYTRDLNNSDINIYISLIDNENDKILKDTSVDNLNPIISDWFRIQVKENIIDKLSKNEDNNKIFKNLCVFFDIGIVKIIEGEIYVNN